MVSWPLLLLLARAAADPEASNDMKARFTAHLTRLRQRHDMKAAEAQFARQFHKKKSALLSPTLCIQERERRALGRDPHVQESAEVEQTDRDGGKAEDEPWI